MNISSNWFEILIVTVVIGAVFGYLWWQGQIKRLSGYCEETWVELQKCAWPSQEELKASTALIMIMIALMGLFVFVIDIVLNQLFFHR